MLRVLILVISITATLNQAAQAQTRTWTFAYSVYGGRQLTPTKIPQAEYVKGVRDGMAMVSRYFNIQMVEQASSNASVFVMVSPAPPGRPSWYADTAWYDVQRRCIHFGINVGGDADSIRRTTMHELTHYFGLFLDYKHPGNRVTDIGGGNATWTQLDVNYLASRGVRLRPGVVLPWNDVPWWRPNRAPIAVPDTVTIKRDRVAVVEVTKNDSDPDGDAFQITGIRRIQGYGTINHNRTFVSLVPVSASVGTNIIEYTIADARGATTTSRLTVIVQDLQRYPWTNTALPGDVDGNGSVTAWDALTVLNAIKQGITEVDPYTQPGGYYDVNGDGRITTGDAHQVLALLGL